MRIIFALLLALPIFGAKIIDYNIYQRDDRVDISLSFDSAYDGGISQKKKENIVIYTINAGLFKEKEMDLDSKIIKKIRIFAQDKKTFIALNIADGVVINASTIGDKFGLRLRASFENQALKLKDDHSKEQVLQQEYDFTNYILVLAVLVLLLVGLWFFRLYLRQKHPMDRNFSLIFQRPLDRHNQLMVFVYGGKRYTMIVGNSNVLLACDEDFKQEEFTKEKPKQKDFDAYFEENKQKLQKMLLKND